MRRLRTCLLVVCPPLLWWSGGCLLLEEGKFTPETDPGTGGDAGAGGMGGIGMGGMGGMGGDPCGNGVLDDGESCDGDDMLGGASCASLGFTTGDLTCDANCSYDTSLCITEECGNGTLENGEQCDGMDFGGATCLSEGFASGEIACDDGCMITSCIDHYTQDFETAPLPDEWGTKGDANWFLSTSQMHAGARSAESGDIANNQQSVMVLTLTFDVAGDFSFWHRESTELNFDYLDFYIDTVLTDSWSGENAWAQASYAVGAGEHTFEWRYNKDFGTSSGDDAVWIDDVVTVNGYVSP